MRQVSRLGLCIAILSYLAAPVGAAGLRTPFGEVVVRRLKIGQTYSLFKMMNLPYRVINTGEDSVTLKIDVIYISTATMKEGYEPLPSLDWVEMEKREFLDFTPNAEAVSDVVIKVPNDPQYLGRRFEADIWARTQSPRGVIAVGMMSRLLISVDSIPPTEEDLKAPLPQKRLTNLEFTVYPGVGRVSEIPMGRDFDVTKERKTAIKIINPTEQPMRFKISSVPNWEVALEKPKDYVDAYVPKWLSFESEEVTVEANSLREVGMTLSIPFEDRFYGRGFFFAVAVDLLEQEIPTRVYYKLLARVEEKKPEKKSGNKSAEKKAEKE